MLGKTKKVEAPADLTALLQEINKTLKTLTLVQIKRYEHETNVTFKEENNDLTEIKTEKN